jgi:(2Fe-2S) ferredoxin
MRKTVMLLTTALCLGACQHEPASRDDLSYGNVNQEALEAYHKELTLERLSRTRSRNVWVDGRRYRVREAVPEESKNNP